MPEQMKNLLVLLGAIVVVLLLIIILFAGQSPFRRFLNLFLEPTDEEASMQQRPVRQHPQEPTQKKTSEPIVEMATLVRKSDDRLRIIESTGQVQLIDEYYELVFVTRKGQKLKIQCSREAYDKIPFNQQGSLTYKRNTLVKFKYYEDVVYNN